MTLIISGENKEVLRRILEEKYKDNDNIKIYTRMKPISNDIIMTLSLIGKDFPFCIITIYSPTGTLLHYSNIQTYFGEKHEYYTQNEWEEQLKKNAKPIIKLIKRYEKAS